MLPGRGAAWSLVVALAAACASRRAGEPVPAEPMHRVDRATAGTSLELELAREAALAGDRAEDERAQEQARRLLACHPQRIAALRFAFGSAGLDAQGEAELAALVGLLGEETRRGAADGPGAWIIVLGARRSEEGRTFAGLDGRRAAVVRRALIARGVPEQQIVAAADFRPPSASSGAEVDILGVCASCCLL